MLTSRCLISLQRVAIVLAAVAAVTSCASTKKLESKPRTAESDATVQQPAPNTIDSVEVQPSTVQVGERVQVLLMGTPGRTASVVLGGKNGAAIGSTRSIDLVPTAPGRYAAELNTTEMAAGTYAVEGRLAGDHSLDPATRFASMQLTLVTPSPPTKQADACEDARRALAVPKIHFAFDRSEIDAAGLSWLRDVATILEPVKARVARLTVEGHCDERGTVEYNLALGARRAHTVGQALTTHAGWIGVAIDTLSKGKEEPLVPNAHSESEHAQNRRAVLLLECRPVH